MTELLPLVISAVAVLATFLYASWQDLRTRTVFTVTWYPAAVVGGVAMAYFWYQMFLNLAPLAATVFVLSLIVAAMMWVFAKAGMFGWADAKAMMLLSVTVPVTPFAASLFPSLALSSLVNAGVIALIVPVFLLLRNTLRKNHAPFWLMCSGMPVPGESITQYFGFVAEEIADGDPVSRRFLPAASSIFSLQKSSGRSIRNLRESPDQYAADLARYRRAGHVWITYGVPFLIPITIGYTLALFGLSLPDMVLSLLL